MTDGQSIKRIKELLGIEDAEFAELSRQVQLGQISFICGPVEIVRKEDGRDVPRVS